MFTTDCSDDTDGGIRLWMVVMHVVFFLTTKYTKDTKKGSGREGDSAVSNFSFGVTSFPRRRESSAKCLLRFRLQLAYVIPAAAGNQCCDLGSRLRGNDGAVIWVLACAGMTVP